MIAVRRRKESGLTRLAAIVLAATAACTPSEPASPWTTVDSAGVSVTTSDIGSVPPVSATSLFLTLGTVGEGGPTEFFRVRDVEILDSGRIAVANGGSEEIRIFGLDGTFVRGFGRAGRGPGEYSGLEVVEERGDSLLTYDGGNDRISVRRLDGELVRSYRLEWFAGALFPVDLSRPDRTLAVTARYMTELEGTGVVVDTSLVSIYDARGRLVDSIARLPHNERFVKQVGMYRTTVGAPYSTDAALAGWGDGFCYAFGPSPQIRCFGADGELREIWRVTGQRRPVEPRHESRFWHDLTADANSAYVRAVRRVRGDLAFPDHFPAFTEILADDAGRLWAQRYRLPDERVEEWWVFESGRLVERVTSPVGFELLDVEGGILAGVWRDELDIEHVRLYRRTPS